MKDSPGVPRVPRILLLVTVSLLLATGTRGMAPRPAYAEDSEGKLEGLRKKIQKEKRVIKVLEKEKSSLLGELEQLDRKVNEADRRLRETNREVARRSEEIKALQKDLASVEAQLEMQEAGTSKRLVLFYRIGRKGLLPLMLSDSSPAEKFRHMDAMKRILGADWERLETFHGLVEAKRDLDGRLKEELENQKRLQGRLRTRKDLLARRKQAKDEMLFKVEQDAKMHRRLLEELEAAAAALEGWITKRGRSVGEQPSPDVSPEARKGTLFAQKGRLPWPVKGSVHRRFGKQVDPTYKAEFRFRGIDIKATPEDLVCAVWQGEVAYSDWFEGYGKMIIVDHGNRDFTVVSHLSRLIKRKGEQVEAGEVVGYAGDTGSMEGCLVHFEVWHDEKPRDPLKWLIRRR